MFVRMAHWSCKPEHWAEAITLFETGALPILARQKGAVAAQLVGKPGGVERMAITVWDGEESYREFLHSEDLRTITDMFAHMYLDGKRPIGFDYPVLRHRVFRPLTPTA